MNEAIIVSNTKQKKMDKIESNLNWDDQFDFGSGKLSTVPDYSDLLKSIEKLETSLRSDFLRFLFLLCVGLIRVFKFLQDNF